jgi:hypothetical protein
MFSTIEDDIYYFYSIYIEDFIHCLVLNNHLRLFDNQDYNGVCHFFTTLLIFDLLLWLYFYSVLHCRVHFYHYLLFCLLLCFDRFTFLLSHALMDLVFEVWMIFQDNGFGNCSSRFDIFLIKDRVSKENAIWNMLSW